MKLGKLLRKITSAAVSAALVFAMTTCASSAFAATGTPSGYISIYEQDSAKYSAVISALADGMRNFQSEINISQYRVPLSDLSLIFEAVLNKNPELFYVSLSYSYSYYPSSGNNYAYAFVPSYEYDKSEADEMLEAFDEKSDFYLSKISPEMSDFEKALILHDELVLNSSYLLDGTTYSLMVDGTGKCEDYSRAYAFLLANAGVKCEMIMSSYSQDNPDGMNHQWVKVCIDGTYYHVDPTWDDPTIASATWYRQSTETRQNGYAGMVFHKYFLVSDALIGTTQLGSAHTGYTSFYPSPDTFDNASFRSVQSPFCYVDGELYTLYYNSNNQTSLARYNRQSDSFEALKTMNMYWRSSGGGYWIGCFSGLNYLDGLFYFNGPDKIYTYSKSAGELSEFASKPADDSIYGINIINRDLYAYTAPNPGEFRDEHFIAHIAEPVPPLDLGDADANGRVDIRDTTMIQRFAAQIESLDARQLAAADVDGDGNVTVNDATEIQKIIAKIA